MQKTPTLTVIIPTFNEAGYIEDALKSVAFADEIILIDSFSEDATLTLATPHVSKVLSREFDNFSNQKNEALKTGKSLAKNRGHDFSRMEVKPSIGNLLLWKSIYETEDKFYIDAIRVGWEIKIFNKSKKILAINSVNILFIFNKIIFNK